MWGLLSAVAICVMWRDETSEAGSQLPEWWRKMCVYKLCVHVVFVYLQENGCMCKISPIIGCSGFLAKEWKSATDILPRACMFSHVPHDFNLRAKGGKGVF